MTVTIARAPSRLPQFLDALTWLFTPARRPSTFFVGKPWLDGDDHYDRTLCLDNGRRLAAAHGITSVPAADWEAARDAAFACYGVNQVLKQGAPSYYHHYASGAAKLYRDTRLPDALSVVRALIPTVDFDRGTDVSREVAFALLDALAADACGLGEVARVDGYAGLALGHLDQWTRPPETRHWGTQCKPFMVALTCLALIRYFERYNAGSSGTSPAGLPPAVGVIPAAPRPVVVAALSAIPAAVERAAGWLWDHEWVAPDTHPAWPHGAFSYLDPPASERPPIACVVTGAVDAATFCGPYSLDFRDDYYTHAAIEFTSGPARGVLLGDGTFDKFRVVGYRGGPCRMFTLSPGYHPGAAAQPGDTFLVHSLADAQGGDDPRGPSPDLNHLIAPMFAWTYARTGLGVWRERYDSIFDGGTMAWGPPSNQKQWNQALLWGPDGLRWRAEGAEREEAAANALPPRIRHFKVTMKPVVPLDVWATVDGRAKSVPVAFEVDGVRVATTMRVAVDEAGAAQGYVANE